MIFEMIHSASLIHDDVIDQSELRRGKPSVNVLFNHKKVSSPFYNYNRKYFIYDLKKKILTLFRNFCLRNVFVE